MGTQTCPLSWFTLPDSICSYFTSAYILHFSFEWLIYNPEEQKKHPSDFPAAASTSQMSILWGIFILHVSFNISTYKRFSAVLHPLEPVLIFLMHLCFILPGWDSVLGKGRYLLSTSRGSDLFLFFCSRRKICLYELPLVAVVKKQQKSSIDATFQHDVL